MPTALSIPIRNANDEPLPVQMGSPMSYRAPNSYTHRIFTGCSPNQQFGQYESMDAKLSSSMISCSVESESSRFVKALSESQPKATSRVALGDFIHSAAGETEFCRDFTCCGIQLNDLHALVEHFEDVHVRVLPSEFPFNPQPTLPTATATTAAPSVSTSNALNAASGGFDPEDLDMEMDGTPSPATTSAPQTPLAQPYASAFDPVIFRRGSDLGPSALFTNTVIPGQLQRAHTISSGHPVTAPSYATCVQPQLLTRTPISTEQLSPPDSPSKTTGKVPSAKSTNIILSTNPKRRPVIVGPIAPNAAADPRPPLPGGKPFRCPQPNCTKSYKQANGLKYHITHGQCSFLPPDPLLETLTDKEADERMRPFVCAVGAGAGGQGGGCGRRYKNMNGLRYHYQHSGAHGAVGLALLASGNHPQPPDWLLSSQRSGSRSRTQSTVSSPMATSQPLISRPPSASGMKSKSTTPTPMASQVPSPQSQDAEGEEDDDMEMDFDTP